MSYSWYALGGGERSNFSAEFAANFVKRRTHLVEDDLIHQDVCEDCSCNGVVNQCELPIVNLDNERKGGSHNQFEPVELFPPKVTGGGAAQTLRKSTDLDELHRIVSQSHLDAGGVDVGKGETPQPGRLQFRLSSLAPTREAESSTQGERQPRIEDSWNDIQHRNRKSNKK